MKRMFGTLFILALSAGCGKSKFSGGSSPESGNQTAAEPGETCKGADCAPTQKIGTQPGSTSVVEKKPVTLVRADVELFVVMDRSSVMDQVLPSMDSNLGPFLDEINKYRPNTKLYFLNGKTPSGTTPSCVHNGKYHDCTLNTYNEVMLAATLAAICPIESTSESIVSGSSTYRLCGSEVKASYTGWSVRTPAVISKARGLFLNAAGGRFEPGRKQIFLFISEGQPYAPSIAQFLQLAKNQFPNSKGMQVFAFTCKEAGLRCGSGSVLEYIELSKATQGNVFQISDSTTWSSSVPTLVNDILRESGTKFKTEKTMKKLIRANINGSQPVGDDVLKRLNEALSTKPTNEVTFDPSLFPNDGREEHTVEIEYEPVL